MCIRDRDCRLRRRAQRGGAPRARHGEGLALLPLPRRRRQHLAAPGRHHGVGGPPHGVGDHRAA
eukprot:14119378-Alexandrium_andersonii.AAC.1